MTTSYDDYFCAWCGGFLDPDQDAYHACRECGESVICEQCWQAAGKTCPACQAMQEATADEQS